MNMNSSFLRMPLVIDEFPDGAISDEIERRIADSLPKIAGLTDTMTQAQRLAVMDNEVAVSRAAFVQTYGNAFGCEEFVPASNAHVVPPVPAEA